MTNKEIDQLKGFIVKCLEDKNAENTQCLHVKNRTSLADYMIFTSGRSKKNIKAIADYISMELKHEWKYNVTTEGTQDSDWILLDAGRVIVNLLHPNARKDLNLEELWSNSTI